MAVVSFKYRFNDTIRREGLVAQWIRRLTTDQEIAGSSPAEIEYF